MCKKKCQVVCGFYFATNLGGFFFFMNLKNICKVLAVSKISGGQNGTNTQNIEFLFQVQFPQFLVKFPVCIFCSTRFDLALVAAGIKGFKGARREKQPKLVGFVYLQFFLSNSFGKFLSGVWQHISCSFYRFRDTREKVENIDLIERTLYE